MANKRRKNKNRDQLLREYSAFGIQTKIIESKSEVVVLRARKKRRLLGVKQIIPGSQWKVTAKIACANFRLGQYVDTVEYRGGREAGADDRPMVTAWVNSGETITVLELRMRTTVWTSYASYDAGDSFNNNHRKDRRFVNEIVVFLDEQGKTNWCRVSVLLGFAKRVRDGSNALPR